MLAIVTNKVLAAYYFSKKDVMAISTFKKLNEAFVINLAPPTSLKLL